MNLRFKVVVVAVAFFAIACGGPDETAVDTTSSTVAPSVTTFAPVVSVTTEEELPPTTLEAATTTTRAPVIWNLLAGGDVLTDRSEPAGVAVFEGIQPAFETADIALVNVEMSISDRGTPVPDKTFTFRAPVSSAERIGAAGVDVATLGNNHAKDYGTDALLDTISLLEAAGVQVVGAGSNRSDAFTAASFVVGDIRVAIVGASYIMPGGFSAGSDRAGVASGKNDGHVAAAVRAAVEDHDVVIVTLHWGIERRTCQNDSQTRVAQELLDAGATAVIGHHPHVLQPVEMSDGKLVAYSLGNFIWHPRSGITGDTGVLELKFIDTELIGFEFYPHRLDSRGAPVPISEGSNFDRINDIISGDCAKHDPGPLPTTSTTELVTTTSSVPTTTTDVSTTTTDVATTTTTQVATTTTSAATTTTSS